MKQIRRCVFETNSSSTHSISIYTATEPEKADIPYNSILEVNGDKAYDRTIFDEVSKLNYIISLLATIENNRYYDDEVTYNKNDFKEFISQPRFVWLHELVREERNTELKYTDQSECGFPYYETTSDNDNSIDYVLSDRNKYDLDNEEQFKQRCRDIIFNKNICIEDKENEH